MNGLRYHLAGINCECLFFAKSKLLLPASVAHLQLLLNICSGFAVMTNLNFNQKKIIFN